MVVLLCALFFLSGAAGLCFETLWFHQAGLAFGSSVAASSIVLASFMAGLALGNAGAARFAPRLARPLHAYAVLELAIGASGVALVYGLPALAPGLAALLRPFVESAPVLSAARLVGGFALLLLPAAAMGATLPVLVMALRARDASFGGALGRLYGWNTLGAVCGALAGELALVEWLGVRGTGWFAAGCNALAAAGALAIGQGAASRVEARAPRAGGLSGAALRILVATALAGVLLLALEVVWFRLLRLFVHSGSAAFAWMLATVLAGIGIGGIAGGAWLRRVPSAWRAAPALALAAGALTAVLYAGLGLAYTPLRGLTTASPLFVAGLATALAFPVAALSGALFPLLGAALARQVEPEARATGWLALANTLGCAAGSLLAGFVLLPWLGIERSIFVLAAGYAGVALASATPGSLRVALVPGVAFAVALLAFPFGRMETRYLRVPVARWHGGHEHAVVAVREGRSETAVYVERRQDGERLATFLLTDGVSMSSTAVFARRYMKLFVYWPVALHPGPREALLISYGVGSTAKALVDTPGLERIDVVDLSREVLELSARLYPDPREHPLRDPRVHTHVEDGRHFLRTTERRYDLITGEPPPPKQAGVVDLYTREYFTLMRSRLADGGIATYWLPVHNLLESDAGAITRAFCDAFPDCSLWVGHDLDWMLVGSNGLRGPRSETEFVRQWSDPRVLPELERLGFERPELLGATFLADADWLRERFADALPLTDDRPKRLSSRLQPDPRAAFGAWLDANAARDRFARSEWIRSLWPSALRERTLAAFAAEALLADAARAAQLPFAERLAGVDALLGDGLGTLALWRLGLTHDHVRAARAALARGRLPQPQRRILGIAALASGDPARAARELAAARAASGADPHAAVLEAYARCLAGERPAPHGVDGPAREAWQWVEARCERERAR
jgi:predicted membrane-bound spermidine synthase